MSETQLSTVVLACAVIGAITYVVTSGTGATAENIWRKVKLTGIGAFHMLLSKDKKFKAEVSDVARAGVGWAKAGEPAFIVEIWAMLSWKELWLLVLCVYTHMYGQQKD